MNYENFKFGTNIRRRSMIFSFYLFSLILLKKKTIFFCEDMVHHVMLDKKIRTLEKGCGKGYVVFL
jgi:hypothetical protein